MIEIEKKTIQEALQEVVSFLDDCGHRAIQYPVLCVEISL